MVIYFQNLNLIIRHDFYHTLIYTYEILVTFRQIFLVSIIGGTHSAHACGACLCSIFRNIPIARKHECVAAACKKTPRAVIVRALPNTVLIQRTHIKSGTVLGFLYLLTSNLEIFGILKSFFIFKFPTCFSTRYQIRDQEFKNHLQKYHPRRLQSALEDMQQMNNVRNLFMYGWLNTMYW